MTCKQEKCPKCKCFSQFDGDCLNKTCTRYIPDHSCDHYSFDQLRKFGCPDSLLMQYRCCTKEEINNLLVNNGFTAAERASHKEE